VEVGIQGIHYDESTCRRWIRGDLHVPKPVFNRVMDIAEYVFEPKPRDNETACFPPAATRMRAYRLAVELAYDCRSYDKADSKEAKTAIAARMQSNSELIPTTTRYLPSSQSSAMPVPAVSNQSRPALRDC
jgi:hypothetical protein